MSRTGLHSRADWLARGVARLGGDRAAARADVELLLAAVLGCPRAALYADPRAEVGDQQACCYQALIERRAGGEPIAYLVGTVGFWSLTLKADARALVPRAETELLVAWALEILRGAAAVRIADLGTGSGAIALALASECPCAQVVGVDRDLGALRLAQENRRHVGVANAWFCGGDWLRALAAERFDLIVANPPYVARDDPRLEAGVARFEPPAALFAGADGLSALRAIAVAAPPHLVAGGWLLCEHAPDQASAVRALFDAAGLKEISTREDLAGRPRATGGRRPDALSKRVSP